VQLNSQSKIDSQVTLSDGNRIPLLGLGVWDAKSGKETYDAVIHALKTGYRHIDTAEMYENEKDVGSAVFDSGIAREEIFITTKLWDSGMGYDHALKAFDVSLKKLNLEYVDLYLIHWPETGPRQEVWNALERIKNEGRCRSIGVSNFAPIHLKEILNSADVGPVVNQIEMNPFLQQQEISSFCKKENIHLTGYCPLARGTRFKNHILCSVAEEINKTPAQLMIRWALQSGHTVIPKSASPKRIEENADVFNFELSEDQMGVLDGLEEGLRFCPDPLGLP